MHRNGVPRSFDRKLCSIAISIHHSHRFEVDQTSHHRGPPHCCCCIPPQTPHLCFWRTGVQHWIHGLFQKLHILLFMYQNHLYSRQRSKAGAKSLVELFFSGGVTSKKRLHGAEFGYTRSAHNISMNVTAIQSAHSFFTSHMCMCVCVSGKLRTQKMNLMKLMTM